MKIKLDLSNPQTWPKGQINVAGVDAITESELATQQARDDTSAMQDAAEEARRIRQRPGISQLGSGSSVTPGSYPKARG